MKLEKNQDSPQKKLREKFLDAALELVKHYYHEDSKCHIHYCEPLSYLGFRGVGSQPNESFYNYQEKVRESAYKVPEKILVQWIGVLDEQIKAKEPQYSAHYSEQCLFVAHRAKESTKWQFGLPNLGIRPRALSSSKTARDIEAAAKKIFEQLNHVGNTNTYLPHFHSHLTDFNALVLIKPGPENTVPLKPDNLVAVSLTEHNAARISLLDEQGSLNDILSLIVAEKSYNINSSYGTRKMNTVKAIGRKTNK